ncbi:RNase A-like domain-containing protein [Paraliobacillus sp. JSM ZJ581]|uniref:RNase A-like domain-containing protein n=1 Tax=Paraliobacillus sp. JSM ZJ581 TaxID=3342118 RepID=UPI0035A86301
MYKITKSLQVIKNTEYGIYGLISANGFSEYLTGKDILGNALTTSQRQASLSLGLAGMLPTAIELTPASKAVTKDITKKAHERVVRNTQSARSFVDRWFNGLVLQTDAAMAGGTRLPINAMRDTHVQQEIHTSFVKVTKGIDNVKQGDKSSLTPGGGLNAHELKGEHLIDRHIGKTDEQLFDRLKNNPKITGSSTFNDRMTAEKVADTVLRDPKNIEKIQKWISDPNSRPTLLLKFKGDKEKIGRSATRNSEVIEDVTNAKIILKKDNNGSFYFNRISC